MADQKLTDLSTLAAPSDDDIIYVVDDPGGTPASKKATVASIKPLTFKTIAVSGQNNVVAEAYDDTLTLVAGSGVTITTDDTADSVTIAADGGGVWEYLGTAALSGSSVEITDIGDSTHKLLKILVVDAKFSDDNTALQLKLKTAGGIQSSAYDYATFRVTAGGSTGAISGSSTSSIQLADAIGNATDEASSGVIELFDPQSGAWKKMNTHFQSDVFNNGLFALFGGGLWRGTDPLTGIVFLPSGGTFAGGNVFVYGLKTT